MVNLFHKGKQLQTRWLSYRGGNTFQKLEKPPILDGKSKELFLVVEGGKGYTKDMGYLIRLLDSNGMEVIGHGERGCRMSDIDGNLSYDVCLMLSLARGKYGR